MVGVAVVVLGNGAGGGGVGRKTPWPADPSTDFPEGKKRRPTPNTQPQTLRFAPKDLNRVKGHDDGMTANRERHMYARARFLRAIKIRDIAIFSEATGHMTAYCVLPGCSHGHKRHGWQWTKTLHL